MTNQEETVTVSFWSKALSTVKKYAPAFLLGSAVVATATYGVMSYMAPAPVTEVVTVDGVVLA